MTIRSYDLVVSKRDDESEGDDMPKESFFNLPKEKRQNIEEAIISEFENYNYDLASTNRIIANCGISKGSLYQYFEDKKDMYKYIIEKISKEKLKYISPVMMNPYEHDFYTVVREMYASGLKFANDNPRLVSIGNRLLNDRANPIYEEIIGQNISAANGIFETLLLKAIERGEVRGDIDTKFMSYIISSSSLLLVDYNRDYANNQSYSNIMETLDKFLDFIQFGIGMNKKEGMYND